MARNDRIAAKVFSRREHREKYPDTEDTDLHHEAALRRQAARQSFMGVADQVAQHTMYVRNWKIPGSDKDQSDPDMRLVTKYYPYAHKAPLLVDEPRDPEETEKAFRKQAYLKERGFRHIVVEIDTTLSDALTQLGEL